MILDIPYIVPHEAAAAKADSFGPQPVGQYSAQRPGARHVGANMQAFWQPGLDKKPPVG